MNNMQSPTRRSPAQAAAAAERRRRRRRRSPTRRSPAQAAAAAERRRRSPTRRNLNPLFDRLWKEYVKKESDYLLQRINRGDYRGLGDLGEEQEAKKEYAFQLFQDAIALVGDLPANTTKFQELFADLLTDEQKIGRNVAFYLLGKVAGSMNVETGVDRIIRDAAVGLVVNAGVCDTYASLVAVLAVIRPGPVEPKQIRVRSSQGHTYPIVYNYKIDVHSNLYCRPQLDRTTLTSDVDLTEVNPDDVLSKLQKYRKVMQKLLNENLLIYLQEYANIHGGTDEKYKNAYMAFIGMPRLVQREAIAEKQRIISQIRAKFLDNLRTRGIGAGTIRTRLMGQVVDGIRDLPIVELRNLNNNWEELHQNYIEYPNL